MSKSWRNHLKPDLNRHNLLLMLKGALPPTIVIAIHQSDAVANTTLTIGYLAALISVVSQALTPRAKFLKIILFDLLATCVSASLCCLAIFCAVKARQNSGDGDPITSSSSSSSGGGGGSSYNSNASAVSAIWLIAMIWAGNALRAWKPLKLQDPMVAFSIFCSVTLTRAGTFLALADGLAFVTRLLKGFMLGFAIATGVSLLLYPVTSRGLVFGDVRAYVAGIEGVVRAYRAYCSGGVNVGADDGESRKRLKGAMAGLDAAHAKLQSDLFYSKDEIAWGKLSARDLDRIGGLLRDLFLPLSGMAMLPDVLDMVMERRQNSSQDSGSDERLDIENVVETLSGRIGECAGLVTAGLQYALLKLEHITPKQLDKVSGENKDEESGRIPLDPRQTGFMALFEQQMQEYSSRQRQLPRTLATGIAEKTDAASDEGAVRQEFFIVLYMLQLQDSLVKATREFMSFADAKVADGTMKQNRVIFPVCSIRNWLSGSSTTSSVQYPDPEHLPPATMWQGASTLFRSISSVIKSEQSIFGFRVAAAAFCVGILAFLHQTQDFFVRQRCIWAMIVIVIGMSPTSGQTLLGFVTRIAATVVSLALSLMVWYIPDQKTAGVIVFLYLANVFEYYFYVTKPQVFGPSIIAIVTLNVIVGYELQIRKLGLEVGTSNGQPYYPIYLFGPYKLLAVAAGCAISFIWVILPYPVTSKSRLRKSLGNGLFVLARFYSCMHSTIELWLRGQLDNNPQQTQTTTMAQLQKARRAIFKEEMTLLASLRALSHFSTFEPPIGGKFPKATYDAIIDQIQRILISMALMAQITSTTSTTNADTNTESKSESESESKSKSAIGWSTRLATAALQSTEFKSHATTSLLCHLGSAITNAQPLPPYLSAGELFPLARWVRHVDGEMLSLRHVDDPWFAGFGLLEVLRSVVGVELEGLLGNVRRLVGELSFDFEAQMEGEGEGEESRALMAGI